MNHVSKKSEIEGKELVSHKYLGVFRDDTVVLWPGVPRA